ncbi:MAG: alpha/beta fold hydrolase [Candidatus Limnocylindrales bacterium]
MRTQRVIVTEGVELAVDTWTPEMDGPRLATVEPVAVREGPKLPAFLLVHGLASNARLWDGVAARLVADGYIAAAVDLRGHGRSSKPEEPYDVPTVADDLAALISALGLDRPVVVGQSWGGNVVLELAARHPWIVRGVVCVDGGWLEPSRAFPNWEACRQALAPPRLVGRPAAEVEAYVRSAHPDWPETGIRGTLANLEVRADGTVAPWLTYEHHLAVLHGLWDHHPSERYPAVAPPVLLVPVDGDLRERNARKRQDVAAALAALPTARVCWFTGDHDLHAQHPDELAAAMTEITRDGFFG